MATEVPEESRISYGRRLTVLAEERGASTALVFAPAEGPEQTFGWVELERRANQVARFLVDQGVAEADLVVIAYRNSPEHVFATFAAWKLGASILPLRHDLPAWERQRMIEIADPRIVLADWSGGDPIAVHSARLAGTEQFDDSPLPDRAPECARLIATSGSTGRPKIIVTPQPGYYSEMPASIAPPDLLGDAGSSVHLTTSPLYHTNGYGACYLSLLGGDRVVLMERFDAGRAVDLIERHRVTHVIMVPTMLQRVARLPDVDQRDFSSLQRVLYGGATVAEWVVRTWIDLVGPDVFWLSYGSSEGIGLCLTTGREWLAHPGTTGRPVNCEVKILDGARRELPPLEVGEIFMRPLDQEGPTFRYVGSDMPAPTDDGFTSIGDVGYVDEDGFLYVVDRRQDMIISGGANVFPAEVEAALSEHPAIVDVVVVGLPDPEWGHRVHAIVQPAELAAAPSDDELRAHCKERLAAYKVPKTFELIEALPRTAAGKINRTALADERTASPSSSAS